MVNNLQAVLPLKNHWTKLSDIQCKQEELILIEDINTNNQMIILQLQPVTTAMSNHTTDCFHMC